ncbi:hypothetical protein KP509_03G098400 [Ceratopteris richardii]|uniref:PGG domain-containing protein n=1 Tax=Ceratopteris richardii TaxID=49495 RepID=A0A8T2VDZ6_CERRI|nr:hypothetical protein KP509_03G098400 [Ceratopteris richardii]
MWNWFSRSNSFRMGTQERPAAAEIEEMETQERSAAAADGNDEMQKQELKRLLSAARKGEGKLVDSILSERPSLDINFAGEDGYTALHFAVKNGHKDVVRKLISLQPKLLIRDKEDNFPISYCKDALMFRELVEGFSESQVEGSVREKDAYKRTILHYAAQYTTDDTLIVKLLREGKHEDNLSEFALAKDNDGNTFFHVAAMYGNTKVFEALNHNLINIDIEMFNSGTNEHDLLNSPGMYALFNNQKKFFDTLVKEDRVKITLSSIIKALLLELIDKGGIQDRLALFANTLPTYLALYANKDFVFEFLLMTIQKLELSQWDDQYYRTCLHWAVVDKRTDIVQKLVSDKIEVQPPSGKTALHVAFERKMATEQWLGIEDRDGKTVLQHAFGLKNRMIMEILGRKSYVKEYEEKLNKDRDVYVQALNAILVGAALIASVAFAGWLQLPYESEFSSPAMRVYWATISISFFTAIATMCVTKIGIIPTPGQYVGVMVNQLRVAILADAFLLALSLAAVMLAFGAAGFAALREAHIYEYEVIMRSTAVVGGVICLITWLAYVHHLIKRKPSMTEILSLLHSFDFSSSRIRCCRRWAEKMRTGLGDSSRLGYPNMERSDLLKIMDEDLVELYRSEKPVAPTFTESKSPYPDAATIKELLKDFGSPVPYIISECQRRADQLIPQQSGEQGQPSVHEG